MLERDVLKEAVAKGLTERQIATQLGCTKPKVHYWLGVHGLRTQHPSKRASNPASLAGRARGDKQIMNTCAVHGRERFVLEASGYYRCTRCRADRVAMRRRDLKATLVAEFGGVCALCSYDRCVWALEFHHRDPAQKSFSIGSTGRTRSLESLRAEAAKCVLLCSNCHQEVESGLTVLPSTLGPARRLPPSAGAEQALPGE
ncbi:MAG TPA: hypothetical protein VFN48_04410 [Solirubrobacteraceae bacterium]|nr:hypothetical protein [Solirubrobacteraceae bacterium]